MKSKISIRTRNSYYDILITDSIEKEFRKIINSLNNAGSLFYVIDSNVYKLHNQKINRIIHSTNSKNKIYLFNAGEKKKSLNTVNLICSDLIKYNFMKDTVLVSIGGGITGDIAGFVASIYMRGIRLIHIPTSITSVIDSTIGGKTGVNFSDLKNIVGSFYNPEAVIIDQHFLKTLPEEEVLSGFGEVIKYAFLSNAKFFDFVYQNFDSLLKLNNPEFNKALRECIGIKSAVVQYDEEESGLRKILNFGHTFGHAIESASGFKIKHGQAVVAGIASALILSHELGYLSDTSLKHLLKLPLKFGISVKVREIDEQKIFGRMMLDKKNRNDQLNLILIKDIGELLIDVSAEKNVIIKTIRLMKDLVTV